MIHIVPKHMVEEIWEGVEPLLAAALEHNPFLQVADLKDMAGGRPDVDLLVAVEEARIAGAAVIELQEYPRCRTGHVLALGGSEGFFVRHLPAMTDALERWSNERGAQSISMLGRPGWTRFVSRRGWQVMPAIGAWKQLGAAAGG
jgi:hypothetical protein